MPRHPEPSDTYGGPPVEEYEKRGEVWRGNRSSDEPDPEPLPEGHPVREAWVDRIRSRALNEGGAPMPSVRQSERHAPDHGAPFVRRGRHDG
jgi:hypothetical protein